MTKEFTWDFKDLVEIKKRKRVVEKVIKPTAYSFLRLQSVSKRQQAIRSGSLITSTKPHPSYSTYEFFIDQYDKSRKRAQEAEEQHKLNVTNAGQKERQKR